MAQVYCGCIFKGLKYFISFKCKCFGWNTAVFWKNVSYDIFEKLKKVQDLLIGNKLFKVVKFNGSKADKMYWVKCLSTPKLFVINPSLVLQYCYYTVALKMDWFPKGFANINILSSTFFLSCYFIYYGEFIHT